MTLPSFVIIVVIAVIAAVIFLQLAALPGAKARERGHPQAEAINILGWLGLLMGFAPWVAALIWAYTRPGLLPSPEASGGVESPATDESQISSE